MKDKNLYVVETILTFRHVYVVEAEELEHAFDEVTMLDSGDYEDYFEPVLQQALPELIVSGRKISKKKFEKLLKDEHVNSPWMGEKLIRKIKYDE